MEKDKRDVLKCVTLAKRLQTGKLTSLWEQVSTTRVAPRMLLVGLSLFVAIVLSHTFITTGPHYQLGDIADRNIKAKHDFLIEDELPTQKKREEAARETPAVYDLDEGLGIASGQRVEGAFAFMRQVLQKHTEEAAQQPLTLAPDHALAVTPSSGAEDSTAPGTSRQDLLPVALENKSSFEHALGFTVPEGVYLALLDRGFSQAIKEKALQWTSAALSHGIIANKPLLLQSEGRPLLIRGVVSGKETWRVAPHNYWDLQESQQFIKDVAAAEPIPDDATATQAALYLSLNLIQPNLNFNRLETNLLQDSAAQAVKPVYIQLFKGEMLVREGQKIGAAELVKLAAHAQKLPKHRQAMVFAILYLFAALAIGFFTLVAQLHLPKFRPENRDYLFLAALLILLLFLARASVSVTDAIGDSTTYLQGKVLLLALPITAGAMLVNIFFGVSASLIFSLLLTGLVAMLLGRDFPLFFFYLVGSLVAAHGTASFRNRMAPIRAGIYVGCANVVMVVLAALLQDTLGVTRLLTQCLCAFLGGVGAGILVTGLTPLAEMLFGYATDVKLLELASMDHPLLQELVVQAPGTYHHSVVVANMVETAAKSIGANPLLAKVSAYYHDIGKIKKSLYFIENQFDGQNRHEKLAPSMSSLILTAHVKDGVELANKHRLGKPITDIISQHHGTRLISFFYHKALEIREKSRTSKGTELPPIAVEDYRYPGPKPQTKEAGLVMLADVVEAACRALPEPTPARINGLVNRLINSVFSDGQLEECELTLKNLHQIAKHFNQILASIHHKRVEYPATPATETKAKSHADSDQREAKADRDRQTTDEEIGTTDLKRLGLH
jgi:putative nucleotidyltransferase with HDIG domain